MKTQTFISIFSFLIFLLAFPISSNAALVYTDIPDHTLIQNSVFQLDLNNDGTNDFEFSYTKNVSGNCGGFPGYVNSKTSVSALSGYKVDYYNGNPAALNLSDTIWGYWYTPNAKILLNAIFQCGQGTAFSGNWNSVTDHYLPVKFILGNDWYYGWIRMNIKSGGYGNSSITITIKDYAYESTPNQPIFFEALLDVTPPIQNVSDTAGTTHFNVTSNLNWSVVSNMDWCIVNPSGSGNDTVTANYLENTGPDPRMAKITVSSTGMDPVVVKVSQDGNESVGIGENSLAGFQVYPNPSSGLITIGSKGINGAIHEVSIYDIIGRIILIHPSIGQGEYHFDLSAEPKGIYFICVTTNDKTYFERIILTK